MHGRRGQTSVKQDNRMRFTSGVGLWALSVAGYGEGTN